MEEENVRETEAISIIIDTKAFSRRDESTQSDVM